MSTDSLTPQSSDRGILAIRRERDLLERILQEKDEKICILTKTLEVEHEYNQSLLKKITEMEKDMKQIEYRNKIKVDSLNHEKNILKSQLSVLKEENTRIKNDPIHHALTTANRQKNKSEGLIFTSTSLNQVEGDFVPTRKDDKEVKLANSAQNVLLQSQLFQAMNSLSALKQQTIAMKNSYNEIINGLQKDLILANDERVQIETELLSHMSILGQEKIVSEQKLKEQLVQKDLLIHRLQSQLNEDTYDESMDVQFIRSVVISDDSEDQSDLNTSFLTLET